MSITIKQVAKVAGVSLATVSRAINGHPDITDKTREHVLNIAEEMGYRPNAMARTLVARRSYVIGVVAGGIEHSGGPARLLTGIEQEAKERGYNLLLSLLPHQHERKDYNPNDDDSVISSLLSYQVDGVIWSGAAFEQERLIWQEKIKSYNVPVVLTDTSLSPSSLPIISVDNYEGGLLAAKHLLEQGYREIGIITGALNWCAAQFRLNGWKVALEEAGILITENKIVEGDWTAAGGERGLYELKQKYPQLDAVFVCSDQMALGALKAASDMGISVPAGLGVVGFDNVPGSGFFLPPLTTIEQDQIGLGKSAVSLLDEIIKTGKAQFAERRLWIQPRLVVRSSTVAQSR